jgi:16S rRNA (guanine1516-N2)-methyltransferase
MDAKVSSLHREQGSVPHIVGVEVVLKTQEPRLVKEAKKFKKSQANNASEPEFILYFGLEGVDIRSTKKPNKRGYQIDFSTIDRRTGSGNLSRKQVFPKAIGANSKTVIDTTAGLGADAAMLALMGYSVTAIEKSPILSILLRDGLYRAQQNQELSKALGNRLTFSEANSLGVLNSASAPDVVYLDPMFPPKRKKSALPSGNIQMLQKIVGYDNQEQTQSLFNSAMKAATKRVVVKRPNYATTFSNNPAAIHKGKLVRYEVYKPACD